MCSCRLSPRMRITSRGKRNEGSIDKNTEKMQSQGIYYAISLFLSLFGEQEKCLYAEMYLGAKENSWPVSSRN